LVLTHEQIHLINVRERTCAATAARDLSDL